MMATVAADAGTLIMTRNYDRVSLGNGVSRLEECSAILCNLGPKKEVKGAWNLQTADTHVQVLRR